MAAGAPSGRPGRSLPEPTKRQRVARAIVWGFVVLVWGFAAPVWVVALMRWQLG